MIKIIGSYDVWSFLKGNKVPAFTRMSAPYSWGPLQCGRKGAMADKETAAPSFWNDRETTLISGLSAMILIRSYLRLIKGDSLGKCSKFVLNPNLDIAERNELLVVGVPVYMGRVPALLTE